MKYNHVYSFKCEVNLTPERNGIAGMMQMKINKCQRESLSKSKSNHRLKTPYNSHAFIFQTPDVMHIFI